MSELDELIPKLDYKNVLRFFAQLSGVPRGSGHNEKISDFLVQFARERGLEYVQDEAKNVLIRKPASEGCGERPPVILQGHMDMVCVADEGVRHDFEHEGLELFAEGDMLGARGTTLGGDDGIAVAYGMALLADDTLRHPPLEILITTDEETGMYGAKALDASILKGRRLINVDSEDEGVVLVSCAGGLRVNASLPAQRITAEGTLLKIELGGLAGGHSGAEIHRYHVNAVYELARLLFDLRKNFDFLLVEMSGGEKDNAIPNASCASLLLHADQADAVKNGLLSVFEEHQKELSGREPDLKLSVTVSGSAQVQALSPVSFEKLMFALMQAPDGVQMMSRDIDGLVESSLNLGIFRLSEEDAAADFRFSVRSSVSSYRHYLSDKLVYLFEFLGGEAVCDSEYPAWEYRKNSPLRDRFVEVFENFYGKKPEIQAIHAGLECGLICEKLPEMDIVSIGPDMKDIHTPRERLSISSSLRVYRFLEKLLEVL